MHELSIAMAIVDSVVEEAQKRGGNPRVISVHLKVGALAGVVKEALVSSYEIAAADSPVAGSTLHVIDMPVVVNCPKCGGQRSVVSPQMMRCSECGSPVTEIVSGKELEVTAMEIDE
jgi:hydrogenase nickel incorporation protein HypA/HybF